MPKTRVYFLFVLFFVMISSGVGWAQGVITLPETGQSKCYNSSGTEISCTGTGQDGEWRAGVAWPEPRFAVSGDCVTDNLTGLMWTKNGNLPGGTRFWQGALDYVASINSAAGLCGHQDWRLPNVNELESLVNAGEANIATWLNSQGFVNVQSHYYWSSTTDADSSNYAWVVDMWSGYVDYGDKLYDYYVWPLRSGQGSLGYSDISIISNPAPFGSANVGATSEQAAHVINVGTATGAPAQLWKTGQTSTYATGDDGDLERGVSWPAPRFTDDGDRTVTDELTGLMWTKDANLPNEALTWQGGLDYVKSINNGAGLGGYHDWRLPNRKELFSLIDHSRYSPALMADHPFSNVQSYYYWSSTTYAYLSFYAWIVDIWYGYVYYYDKSYFYYVWPVRSGQGLGYSDISITPNPVPFGNVNVGGTPDQTITVKNDGNANLVIGTITNPEAPFSKQTENCSEQSIPPSGTCTVTYRFAPTSGGTFSSNSNIPSNDPDNDPKTIILTGTGCPTPGTPASPSPPNGALGISTSPALTWAAASNTDSYDVYFGTSTNPPLAGNVTNHSYPLSGLSPNTLYYWKVVAKNSCGNSTSGPTWSFTTCPAPGIPLGPSPPDTATGISANPILSWTATLNTDSYDVYFGTSTTPPLVGNVTSTSYPLSGLNPGTVYHWKVVAKNNCGNSTPGPVWSFTTICPTPGAFSYLTPSNGSTNQLRDVDLDWDDSSGATSYDVYFGTANPPTSVISKSGSSHDPGTLGYGTTYYWNIVAKNGCGENAGPVWSFVIRSLDITPEEGTIGTTVTIKGNNFGVKKGTVFIGSVALKSTGWGNSEIQASLSKAIFPGIYSVTVKPKTKGVLPITDTNVFTVLPPEIDSVSPHSGSPGQSVTINGKFFGTKKGKVYLEYESKGVVKLKSCKVLSWDMDPKFSDGEVVFVVPKGLPLGAHPLKLVNSVGEALVDFTIVSP